MQARDVEPPVGATAPVDEGAVEALEHVERQLQLTHERRRQLDSIEAKLWARQNRLEGFLIHTRGSAWWHARRTTARAGAADPASYTERTTSS